MKSARERKRIRDAARELRGSEITQCPVAREEQNDLLEDGDAEKLVGEHAAQGKDTSRCVDAGNGPESSSSDEELDSDDEMPRKPAHKSSDEDEKDQHDECAGENGE